MPGLGPISGKAMYVRVALGLFHVKSIRLHLLYGIVLEVVEDETRPFGMGGKQAVFIDHKAANAFLTLLLISRRLTIKIGLGHTRHGQEARLRQRPFRISPYLMRTYKFKNSKGHDLYCFEKRPLQGRGVLPVSEILLQHLKKHGRFPNREGAECCKYIEPFFKC